MTYSTRSDADQKAAADRDRADGEKNAGPKSFSNKAPREARPNPGRQNVSKSQHGSWKSPATPLPTVWQATGCHHFPRVPQRAVTAPICLRKPTSSITFKRVLFSVETGLKAAKIGMSLQINSTCQRPQLSPDDLSAIARILETYEGFNAFGVFQNNAVEIGS